MGYHWDQCRSFHKRFINYCDDRIAGDKGESSSMELKNQSGVEFPQTDNVVARTANPSFSHHLLPGFPRSYEGPPHSPKSWWIWQLLLDHPAGYPTGMRLKKFSTPEKPFKKNVFIFTDSIALTITFIVFRSLLPQRHGPSRLRGFPRICSPDICAVTRPFPLGRPR